MAAVLAKSPRRIQMNILRNLTADQLVDALVAMGRLREARSEGERAVALLERERGTLEILIAAPVPRVSLRNSPW